MQDDAELVQISRSDDVEGFFSGVNYSTVSDHRVEYNEQQICGSKVT
jgi:hypothetical protein